jgi:hypothetical protein
MESRSVLASSTLKTGVLARFDDVRRAFDRRRRVSWHDLVDLQIIKESKSILMAARCCLNRLRRAGMFLYIGRNKHESNRPDVINVIF